MKASTTGTKQFRDSAHATIRRQQRGIKQEEEQIVLEHGLTERSRNGCVLRYLTRRQRAALREQGIGVQLPLNSVFVQAPNGAIVTAYHLA